MMPVGQSVAHIKEDIAMLAQELQALEQQQPEASALGLYPAAEAAHSEHDEQDEVSHQYAPH